MLELYWGLLAIGPHCHNLTSIFPSTTLGLSKYDISLHLPLETSFFFITSCKTLLSHVISNPSYNSDFFKSLVPKYWLASFKCFYPNLDLNLWRPRHQNYNKLDWQEIEVSRYSCFSGNWEPALKFLFIWIQ